MKTEEELIWEKYSQTDKESFEVSVSFNNKEDADSFKEFMSEISGLCNAGSSRSIGINDPSGDDERQMSWSFDGDGNTRIEVL